MVTGQNKQNREESELVRDILKHPEKFEIIVDMYSEKLYWYAMRLLNFHKSDAEDVTAEAMTKAYINLASFNPQYTLKSWLYRITHNEAVNYAKKYKTRLLLDFTTLSLHTPHAQTEYASLESILNQLRLDERNLLTLFYLDGFSLKEIAHMMKKSENTITVALHRARDKAKKLTQQQSL